MKTEVMEYFRIKPHFYASLFGSLVATSDIANGRVLSDLDLFSSTKFYLKLSQMYKPWRKVTNYLLSDSENTIISNAAGLFIPWMNTLAGRISPESRRINDVQSLFKELIYHLIKIEIEKTHSPFEWEGILLDFRLRLGSNPLTLVEELISPVIELMQDYQEKFYAEFWEKQEISFYKQKIDQFMGSSLKNDLKYGLELLNKWIFNNLPESPVIICLNRFLSSINPEIKYNSGFGLHGSSAIHITPHDLNHDLYQVLHEIFHSLIYESKIMKNSEEIKIIGSHISSYLKNEKSPIPFWTWKDIYTREIEEILADFVAGEVYKEIYTEKDYQSSYAQSDEFLQPIFTRLTKYSSILRQEGLKAVISSSFKNWKYEK